MEENSVLNCINSPSDVKKLSDAELELLCTEIRQVLIDTVASTGGHLASNLGTVELTVALHRMFDSQMTKSSGTSVIRRIHISFLRVEEINSQLSALKAASRDLSDPMKASTTAFTRVTQAPRFRRRQA